MGVCVCMWVDLTPKLKEISKLVGLEIDSGTNKQVNYKTIQITLHTPPPKEQLCRWQ